MARASLSFLTFYKRLISPRLGTNCRFQPSCSDFAREAVERYGGRRGWALTFRRLLRCTPLSRGGYDPVP